MHNQAGRKRKDYGTGVQCFFCLIWALGRREKAKQRKIIFCFINQFVLYMRLKTLKVCICVLSVLELLFLPL